ncbi:exonuclease V [Hypoxylon sp. FL0890]|nr:exonuclease V [Hypoxylon sp. FL0890]
MATSVASMLDSHNSPESDYGSDFSIEEEGIVNQLLEDLRSNATSLNNPTSAASSPAHSTLPAYIDAKVPDELSISLPFFGKGDQYHVAGLRSHLENALPNTLVTAPAVKRGRHSSDSADRSTIRAPAFTPFGGVQYPDLSRDVSAAKYDAPADSVSVAPAEDSRSPLQRFRSFPKKPLTVSDFASGAWCELQYWYTLTLLPGGRKTRTAAMRGGTRVHQTLEDQVHTTVQVNVTNKEEAFALRLWNVIQGLRTLRDAGMTRELEVWGIIDGEVVNGIIDEVSHISPNAAFEQELSLSQLSKGFITPYSKPQAEITDYLEPQRKKVYLTDVKTRGSDRLPTGAALRPARVQLFLYHRLLGEMASGVVDFAAILDRYGIRPDVLFSDAFMAQVGDLNDEIFYDADSDFGRVPPTPCSSRSGLEIGDPNASPKQSHQMTPPPDLIRYRSIAQMLPLLESELRETFPQGAATLADLLAVQYRHRDDGRILGNNCFPNDPEALDGYIGQNLKWWRGEKEADGVSIEETYKCRSCEFADGCQWRKDKEAEVLQKRRSARRA